MPSDPSAYLAQPKPSQNGDRPSEPTAAEMERLLALSSRYGQLGALVVVAAGLAAGLLLGRALRSLAQGGRH